MFSRPILASLLPRIQEPRRFLQVLAGPRKISNSVGGRDGDSLLSPVPPWPLTPARSTSTGFITKRRGQLPGEPAKRFAVIPHRLALSSEAEVYLISAP